MEFDTTSNVGMCLISDAYINFYAVTSDDDFADSIHSVVMVSIKD